MKKLIALILILVITSFVVVSKDGVPLNQKMDPRVSTGKREHSNPKNKKWEYIKDRLFDGETEKVYRIEVPILLILNKASKQDSLAVSEIMKELRTILPNKTIAYFDDFTGVSYQNLTNRFINTNKDTIEIDLNNANKKIRGFSLWELKNNSIKINFVDKIPLFPMNLSSRIYDHDEIERTVFIKNRESVYNENRIFLSFNKSIPYERRKRNIEYEIYRTLCYINPNKDYPMDFNHIGVYVTPDYIPDESKFNNLDKFLLQKLYSDDFIDQFKTYMYANYPWRYASSFVNKKEHNIKVFGIIISLGILIFVLMFSYFQNRKYKYSYLNYWFPIFLILLHFINLTNIYEYLTKFNSVIGWSSHIFFKYR